LVVFAHFIFDHYYISFLSEIKERFGIFEQNANAKTINATLKMAQFVQYIQRKRFPWPD